MLKNSLLIVCSVVLTLLLMESILRIFYNPIDYLLAKPSPHPYLNHKIEPFSTGHDKWGFRNEEVPEQAKVVAIGDSMTYGVMASSTSSWPAHLSNKLGANVYNLSLGGYGPLQYLYLFQNYALKLNPDTVILGIYLGNDLMDAYNLAYSNEQWSNYRDDSQSNSIESNLILPEMSDKKLFSSIRSLLSRTSVLYRIVTQNKIFDNVRLRETKSLHSTTIPVAKQDYEVLLKPIKAFRHVNINDDRIQDALRITKSAILDIVEIGQKHNIDLQVAIIPIKENVYREEMIANCEINCDETVYKKLLGLDEIRTGLFLFLENNEIPFVDLLPALRKASSEEPIYPPHDGHPNGIGYKTIANELHAFQNTQ